jgi:hypothetical protein
MIKMKKINKKGIFYSLSVIVFLLFLILVFINKSEIQKKEEQFHIERAQIIVMDHFVRDFDRYYVEVIIHNAARTAMISITRFAPFTYDNLVDLMEDGTGGGATMNPLFSTSQNFAQALGTLTFMLDNNELSYRVASVEQLNETTIKLNFLVDYSFESFNTNWSKKDKPVNITMSAYGLWHPDHDALIDSSWVPDNAAGCYINDIISNPASVCAGKNIMPPPPVIPVPTP